MDSLTHIVVGACAGELIAGKQLGKKALLIGAIANSLPDIDFVASFFLSLSNDLLAHRGFTHSLLFNILATPILAFLCTRLFKKDGLSWGRWTFFWSVQMLMHIFIDAFNSYGTGWFEPFSHYRVAFNTMFVADPLFTLWPTIAAIALIIARNSNQRRKRWATIALSASVLYLVSGIGFKMKIDQLAHKELKQMGVAGDMYFSTPTPLNNILWYIVARHDSGFYIGYRSLLDGNRKTVYRYTCQNAGLLKTATNKEDVDNLIRFSQGFYTAGLNHDTLLFNDLRFGEIAGWSDTMPRCVFYYYPDIKDGNDLVVQRGRFANWDANAFITFLRRIAGK